MYNDTCIHYRPSSNRCTKRDTRKAKIRQILGEFRDSPYELGEYSRNPYIYTFKLILVHYDVCFIYLENELSLISCL